MSDITTVVRMSAKSGLQGYAELDGDRCSNSKSTTSLMTELRDEWARERLIRHASRSIWAGWMITRCAISAFLIAPMIEC